MRGGCRLEEQRALSAMNRGMSPAHCRHAGMRNALNFVCQCVLTDCSRTAWLTWPVPSGPNGRSPLRRRKKDIDPSRHPGIPICKSLGWGMLREGGCLLVCSLACPFLCRASMETTMLILKLFPFSPHWDSMSALGATITPLSYSGRRRRRRRRRPRRASGPRSDQRDQLNESLFQQFSMREYGREGV